jgi:hypothetical protein
MRIKLFYQKLCFLCHEFCLRFASGAFVLRHNRETQDIRSLWKRRSLECMSSATPMFLSMLCPVHTTTQIGNNSNNMRKGLHEGAPAKSNNNNTMFQNINVATSQPRECDADGSCDVTMNEPLRNGAAAASGSIFQYPLNASL